MGGVAFNTIPPNYHHAYGVGLRFQPMEGMRNPGLGGQGKASHWTQPSKCQTSKCRGTWESRDIEHEQEREQLQGQGDDQNKGG